MNLRKERGLRRYAAAAVATVMLFCSAGIHASAAEAARSTLGQAAVTVTMNGSTYPGTAFISSSTTYVGLREFSMNAGARGVSWDAQTRTAAVSAPGLEMSVSHGSIYMKANDRYILLQDETLIIDGTLYVPVRSICRAFGYTVGWDAATKAVSVSRGSGAIASGAGFYDADSVLWLARIIHAEANGEPLRGKVAVGNVVLNRVKSPMYPNTIYGVIFDKKNGIQFTPAANGSVYCNPGEDSIIAAKICLDGGEVLSGAMFFVNEAIAQNSWVSDNRAYVTTIGNHKFFA